MTQRGADRPRVCQSRSDGTRRTADPDARDGDLYLAAVESIEEAVVNALVAAETMTTVKPPGLTCRAIDHQALREALRRYGRVRG